MSTTRGLLVFFGITLAIVHMQLANIPIAHAENQSATVLNGSMVLFTEHNTPSQGSSRDVGTPSNWVGKVTKIKSEKALVAPMLKDGKFFNGPAIYRPLSVLSPEVKSHSGFSVRDQVTQTADSGTKGAIDRIFANGMAEVTWFAFRRANPIPPRYLFLNQLDHLVEASTHPLGLRIGDIVYLEKKISPKTLINQRKNLFGEVTKEENKYPISEISLGQIPYIGKIAGFTGGNDQAWVQVEMKNGSALSNER